MLAVDGLERRAASDARRDSIDRARPLRRQRPGSGARGWLAKTPVRLDVRTGARTRRSGSRLSSHESIGGQSLLLGEVEQRRLGG